MPGNECGAAMCMQGGHHCCMFPACGGDICIPGCSVCMCVTGCIILCILCPMIFVADAGAEANKATPTTASAANADKELLEQFIIEDEREWKLQEHDLKLDEPPPLQEEYEVEEEGVEQEIEQEIEVK